MMIAMSGGDQEEWRAIEGWPYEVSSLGRVRRASAENGRTRPGKLLRPQTANAGYLKVFLCRDGHVVERRINRLVCTAFEGLPPSTKHEAAHRDGNHLNNCRDNVYWATPKQNSGDKIRHRTTIRGERCNLAKLTDEQAEEIREAAAIGIPDDMLAESFGVTPRTIERLRRGLSYRPFSHPPP